MGLQGWQLDDLRGYPMFLQAELAALAAVVSQLPPGQQGFAKSLLAQAETKALSQRQWDWVIKLTAEATKRADMADSANAAPEKKGRRPVLVGNGIAELFDRTNPEGRSAFWIATENGDTLKITRANKGGFHVADGGPYGQSKYYGHIDLNGMFTPRDETPEGTITALRTLSVDREAAFVAFGKRTGICGCCGAELTNAESIARGIGPICAGKYL
jgi:hypothetical protein